MTLEVPGLLVRVRLTGHGVSSIVDTVIRLRYVEVNGHLERAVSVLKARDVKHSTELRRLEVDSQRANVDKGFEGRQGVLIGTPVPLGERSERLGPAAP